MRTWLINPTLSAMENLFSAARYAALAFKSRADRGGAALTKSEWNDVLDDVVLSAVSLFMKYKIRNHEYNRNFSFFHNVRSCVWSRFYDVLRRHMAKIKEKMTSYDRLDPIKREHSLEMYHAAKPACHSERSTAMKNMRSWIHRRIHETYCMAEDANDFFSYLEACEETGLPIKKDTPLYRRGREITGESFEQVKPKQDRKPEDR